MDKNENQCVWLDGIGCSCFVCNCNCNKRYKKHDAVRISAEIKQRDIVNSNPLIYDMPASYQTTTQKLVGDAFMMGAEVAHTTQDHLNIITIKGM